MPIIHTTHQIVGGARVRIQITLGRADVRHRRQAGMAIPAPVPAIALLDIGAECTCVDPAIIAPLNLPVSSGGLIVTPGGVTGPAALGGASPRVTYEAGLVIPHGSDPKLNLVIPSLEIEAIPLTQFGIDALIGRDVLANCVLVYDGPAGTVTLAH